MRIDGLVALESKITSSVTQNGQDQYELSLQSLLLCFCLSLENLYLGTQGSSGCVASVSLPAPVVILRRSETTVSLGLDYNQLILTLVFK